MPSSNVPPRRDDYEPTEDDERSRTGRRRKPADADDRVDYQEWVDERRDKGRKRRDLDEERHRYRDGWDEPGTG